MARQRPIGTITRGTTNPNRLRRVDRWLAATQSRRLDVAAPETVVDLGYGARGITTRELFDRLRTVRADVQVVGLEIDPVRVRAAQHLTRPGLRFALGGFEVPLPQDRAPGLVRAFNVLRQYDEGDVAAIWDRVRSRLPAHGLFVDGTCDELGRLSTWVAITADGPQTLTLSLSFRAFERPGEVAPRLPKALIHRNVPGEGIHDYLRALDEAWWRSAPLSAYGRRQRFVATIRDVAGQGWPILREPRRWRIGEVSVAWAAVAPGSDSR